MQNVLQALLDAHQAGKNVVYTALIETRGSTPQKAGATMLVFENGAQVGTLGGGCVEAEVKRNALENLAANKTEVVSFQLNHDYGWDDGLICGGRMTMLIAPVPASSSTEYYEDYHRCIARGDGCTEAVVVKDTDDGPSTLAAGSRYLFDANGRRLTTSPEAVPEMVSNELISLEDRPRPYLRNGISYLPHLPKCRLLIVGAGHVGKHLAQYAADADFDVHVADDREIYCNREMIPFASACHVGPFDEMLPALEVDQNTFCVVVTRGHNHDQEALFHLIKRQPRYLGMIGSKRKIRLIFDDLAANGIPQADLDRVHAPIGLEIGSQTVPEIAISIVAELIAERNVPSSVETV